ncbi:hypothetical protein [Flavobacterium sp.]|uniref:hypothetical protein n=1 Tax=Flavobacterium sp. TaxID=239 RepID=UPI003C433A7A
MKKLILSIVLTLFVGVVSMNAKELKPKKSYTSANQEISNLLTPSYAMGELESQTTIRVRIRVNANNEIVVLETTAPDTELNEYIIDNLNYKKLISSELVKGNEYVFNVNFKS